MTREYFINDFRKNVYIVSLFTLKECDIYINFNFLVLIALRILTESRVYLAEFQFVSN